MSKTTGKNLEERQALVGDLEKLADDLNEHLENAGSCESAEDFDANIDNAIACARMLIAEAHKMRNVVLKESGT